jgi:hypothetical protein
MIVSTAHLRGHQPGESCRSELFVAMAPALELASHSRKSFKHSQAEMRMNDLQVDIYKPKSLIHGCVFTSLLLKQSTLSDREDSIA